jgi:transaldolase/glucose-6-phosphate isomerase
MTLLADLEKAGQSLWYDNIQKSMLQNGSLEEMILKGEIKGVTSNPSIFLNAITKSKDYDSQIKTMAWAGLTADDIFWNLAIDDVQKASDLFRNTYEKSVMKDGYVSLEVNPKLAFDTRGTIAEAKRLWKIVNRPNLMIKIPATKEGIPAVREVIAAGINVNITLIFSIERYQQVLDAYLSGLEDRLHAGKSIGHIASVASFFISRIDTKIDPLLLKSLDGNLEKHIDAKQLIGRAAIENARKAYQLFLDVCKTERFKLIKNQGGQIQRPLWASTSTKNPNYRDVLYIEELIGPDTVNTVPPATLAAFLDHGKVSPRIIENRENIDRYFEELSRFPISIAQVALELENEGVTAFVDAYSALISAIDEMGKKEVRNLGNLSEPVKKRISQMQGIDFVGRLFAHDPSLWTSDLDGQKEITNRMDWIEAPWKFEEQIEPTYDFLHQCRSAGFTHALLLGMGGSSLGPEVLRLIHGVGEHNGDAGLELSILDSTNPLEVIGISQRIPLEKTLFIVSSKSGTTGEINAFFEYFFESMSEIFPGQAGSRFIAITDPGTKLEKTAREKNFRKVFNANPKVGGRNSVLTSFGLVPAALIGMDLNKLLRITQEMANYCRPDNQYTSNPGLVLGVILGEAVLVGQNKLTILSDPAWLPFGSWMEQLIAESSGKDGKGIIPIANEPLTTIDKYGKDRLFVYLRNNGERDRQAQELTSAGHPLVTLNVNSSVELGANFYLWEIAVATACSIISVNSFDQPDVQDAKTKTLASISAYRETGKLDEGKPILKDSNFKIYSNQYLKLETPQSPEDIILSFISNYAKSSDYVALNAFLPRFTTIEDQLQLLRKKILDKFGLAITLGFGPRFLHSTGQLHKGGPNNGIFIIFTSKVHQDVEIPGEGLTFGTFSLAQALGDQSSLESKGRRLIRVHYDDLENPLF